MFKILSILYAFLYEIFFDDKEEYNIKSHKFKFTRVLGVIVFSLSILTNFWVYKEYLRVVNSCEAPAKPTPEKKEPAVAEKKETTSYTEEPHEETTEDHAAEGFKSIDEIMEEERRKRDTYE